MSKVQFMFVVATAALFSSCGINDLEDRLDKVENAIGSNEPMFIDFTTKDAQDRDISLKDEFIYQASGYNSYLQVNSDGTVDVYIENFKDVDWNVGAWASFRYDQQSKEISDINSGSYFYNRFGTWTTPRWRDDYEGQQVSLNLKSIDLQKGFISFEFTGTSTAESVYNEFQGKAMNMLLKYTGTVEVFEVNNSNTRIPRRN